MKYWLISIGLLMGTALQAQSNLCERIDELVNDLIPEGFEGTAFEESTIEEVEGEKVYNKISYSLLGAGHLYYLEEELNKKILCYPSVPNEKEAAVKKYLELIESSSACELIYTTQRQPSNPNIGLIAHYTLGIDRRFYNSNLRLYEYQSDTVSKYWIEYEIIAPRQL